MRARAPARLFAHCAPSPACWRCDIACSRALQDYGAEPKFDASDRPPSSGVLGRATWTMLHTTAAYLPEKLQPEEAAGFKDLVSSVVNLYPGDGGRLIRTIFDDSSLCWQSRASMAGNRGRRSLSHTQTGRGEILGSTTNAAFGDRLRGAREIGSFGTSHAKCSAPQRAVEPNFIHADV